MRQGYRWFYLCRLSLEILWKWCYYLLMNYKEVIGRKGILFHTFLLVFQSIISRIYRHFQLLHFINGYGKIPACPNIVQKWGKEYNLSFRNGLRIFPDIKKFIQPTSLSFPSCQVFICIQWINITKIEGKSDHFPLASQAAGQSSSLPLVPGGGGNWKKEFWIF